MRNLPSISLRWFVCVSLVVTLIYLLAVGRGVLHSKELWAMKAGMAARAAADVSAHMIIGDLYFAAEHLAQDPKVSNLMAQAQQAVSRFGRESTQAKAARQAMRREVILPWLFTSREGDHELRFYLNPGPVCFLAISGSNCISQTSTKPNAVVTAASRRSQAVVGFTLDDHSMGLDDHSMGLRAVAPVWAQGTDGNEKRVVGFVELGHSGAFFFKAVFGIIKEGEDETSFAVLAPVQSIKDKARSQGWPFLPKIQICQGDYALIHTTSPLIHRICKQRDLKEILGNRDHPAAEYMALDGESYILSATRLGPRRDKNSSRNWLSEMGITMMEEDKPRGGGAIMLMWMPVEPWTQSVWQFVKSHPIQLGGGLAIILTVIFLAWGLTNTQLSKLVSRRTAELAQANRELARAKDRSDQAKGQAEQANRAKSSFLATMSHEIRTPLNAVVGLADMTMGADLTPDRQDNLQAIKDSSCHLLSIIDDILDFSKIEAGRVELENLDFDLHDLLRSTVQTFRNSAVAKGLSLKLELESSIPAYVKGDPVRLRQVLNNLLGNALKFTSQGGVVLSVRPGSWKHDCSQQVNIRLLFCVGDSGVGVPPELRDEIFDSFRQADGSTSRRFGGTGLGLAICRQLVEMMGGRIWVQSGRDQGSEFFFTTVFQVGAQGKAGQAPEISAEKILAVAGSVILLAEDNATNQKVGISMLQRYGYQVVAAQNGKDTIEKLRASHFDLVLMDVAMPVMGGIEAARRIRAGEAGDENLKIPILALTAHALPEIQQKCAQAGMDDFFTKPLDYVSLAGLIQDILTEQPVAPAKAPLASRDKQSALERMGGSQELYESACTIFAEDIPQRIGLMRHALKEGDLGALQDYAHYVKGAAKTLGATLAGSLAESLELAARDRNDAEARNIFRHLEPVLTELAQELSPPDNG